MCSVFGCDSERRGAPRFKLPQDPEMRLLWVQFLATVNMQRFKEASWTDITICSEHFGEDCFDHRTPAHPGVIHPSAVPSLGLRSGEHETDPQSPARAEPEETTEVACLRDQLKTCDAPTTFSEDSRAVRSRSIPRAVSCSTDTSNTLVSPSGQKRMDFDLIGEKAALLQMKGKYVVNEARLLRLFRHACPSCGSEVKMEKVTSGLLVVFNQRCLQCDYRSQWRSQVNASVPAAEEQQLPEVEATPATRQISGFALRARTVIMGKARRNAYDAAFKLKAIRLAIKEGNRAAAQTLGVNESMVRRWRGQREELTRCKKRTKAFRGNKSRWPELENVLEDWVNTQRARGRSVSTVQIRLKAKTIATEKNIEHFRGGPSWCFRFMQRKGLFVRERTTPRQQLPPDLKDKIANFSEFTHRNIAENSIGPDDVINMDEVPLTFNLPLTRTVLQKGESSVTLKTTGHERTHFTCVLSCTASGLKLPPMVIFKRVTMPKEKFPKGIAVKVNKKGWMIERLMKKWLNECYGKRPGGFRHRKRALLVLDSTRAHMTDSVKAAIKMTNTIPAVIPEGTRKYLQPLDISVNRAFKLALRVQWEAWMTSSKKSFAETGRMRRATFSQVCQWILTAWSNVKESTITDAFQKAGLLRDEEEEEDGGGGESSRADSPREESDTESTNKRGTECNEALLRLFNSDTEEEDFNGFSAQEDDGDSDQ